MKRIALAFALLLSGCNIPGSSDMPDLKDEASVKATILKLDPIAPGGPPNDHGPGGGGQSGSDRSLFIGWLLNYAAHDAARQMNIDYEPAPLPTSVAAAIKEERAREERERKGREAARARMHAEQASQRAREDKAFREEEERQAAMIKASNEAMARRAERDAERAIQLQECEKESFKAQAAGALEDQARIYQAFNCDQFRGPGG